MHAREMVHGTHESFQYSLPLQRVEETWPPSFATHTLSRLRQDSGRELHLLAIAGLPTSLDASPSFYSPKYRCIGGSTIFNSFNHPLHTDLRKILLIL
jgi:hypothetical protein